MSTKDMTAKELQSLGGKARANKLSPQRPPRDRKEGRKGNGWQKNSKEQPV